MFAVAISIFVKHGYKNATTKGIAAADIEETPHAAIRGLIGPIMVRQMFRRAIETSSTLTIDPQEYVDTFLYGRATSS